MTYATQGQQIDALNRQIFEIREQIRELRRDRTPELVDDYAFASSSGEKRLSELFGAHDTLFVVHNMGRSCAYCTLWADEINGVIDHLGNRSAFVVSSPDDPATQAEFAESRGWRFTMVCHGATSFAADMGYADPENDTVTPGVSVFKKTDDGIARVADTPFGPGDDFCSVWHFFDLIPQGADGWSPKYEYAS